MLFLFFCINSPGTAEIANGLKIIIIFTDFGNRHVIDPSNFLTALQRRVWGLIAVEVLREFLQLVAMNFFVSRSTVVTRDPKIESPAIGESGQRKFLAFIGAQTRSASRHPRQLNF